MRTMIRRRLAVGPRLMGLALILLIVPSIAACRGEADDDPPAVAPDSEAVAAEVAQDVAEAIATQIAAQVAESVAEAVAAQVAEIAAAGAAGAETAGAVAAEGAAGVAEAVAAQVAAEVAEAIAAEVAAEIADAVATTVATEIAVEMSWNDDDGMAWADQLSLLGLLAAMLAGGEEGLGGFDVLGSGEVVIDGAAAGGPDDTDGARNTPGGVVADDPPGDSADDPPGNPADGVPAPIVSVQIVVAESYPPQYFVHVIALEPDACHSLGGWEAEREDDMITVAVFNYVEGEVCAQVATENEISIPLGADFDSGRTYTVVVNGGEEYHFVAE